MGLYLSAEVTDYTEALQAIQQQIAGLGAQIASLGETAKVAVGVLAGIVCFLGVLFGFKFIKTLLEHFKG